MTLSRDDFRRIHREAREARQAYEDFEDGVSTADRYGADISASAEFAEDHAELMQQLEELYLTVEDVLAGAGEIQLPAPPADAAGPTPTPEERVRDLPRNPPRYILDRREKRQPAPTAESEAEESVAEPEDLDEAESENEPETKSKSKTESAAETEEEADGGEQP